MTHRLGISDHQPGAGVQGAAARDRAGHPLRQPLQERHCHLQS